MTKGKEQVLHIRIPQELHRLLRVYAAERGLSVSAVVLKWLQQKLEADK